MTLEIPRPAGTATTAPASKGCVPKQRNLPASQCRRSKPMSMMRSNPMSETSEPITAGLVLSKLCTMQVSASGDHVERSFGSQVSQAGPKQSKLKIHPYCTYDITRYTRYSPVICRRYLPSMKSEMSISNMPIAIAIIIFALFQMAILPRYLERIALGG